MITTKESIYTTLSWDNTLNQLTDGRCYPSTAFEDAVFPYIVFKWENLSVNNNFEKHTFKVEILAKSEKEMNEITDRVKELLGVPFWSSKMSYIEWVEEDFNISESTFKATINLSVIV